MNTIKFTIKPSQVLDEQSINYRVNGKWLSVKSCPSCGGGKSEAKFTFAVHCEDGNFFCLRTTCNWRGSFWALLEHFGYSPKKYIDREGSSNSQKKIVKRRYVYGQ